MQCGAKTRNGEPCKSYAMENGRCRMHGGKSLGGIVSPRTSHGRHSKYLPNRMLADYEAARQDSDLLNLGNEIAVIDARISDLMRRVDSGESGHLWKQTRVMFEAFRDANAMQDKAAANAALTELYRLIQRGNSDYAAWNEIQQLMEQRRRLVESERKRRIDMHTMIRDDEVMLLIRYLTDSIRTHVKDRDTLVAIQRDITAALGTRVQPRYETISDGAN